MELRVGGKYKVTKRLGSGAFGDIYAGVNVKTNEEVAIKLVSLPHSLHVCIWLLGIAEHVKATAELRG